ncbi:FG-GAP repeat domain-containing protein [Streptomyces sp. 8L]|uniref:FG-GAP repeat domain-containing protein n=1 Tax=Streptomyces sp. 8L TaxID=2877242 RepID=UPI001CD65A56|nr:VCBS repeat-containing protein [Streptomyces sp. 8L]MCA1217220.1 VCBS repeat-containing protein [Streptomyces sp. 8L]
MGTVFMVEWFMGMWRGAPARSRAIGWAAGLAAVALLITGGAYALPSAETAMSGSQAQTARDTAAANAPSRLSLFGRKSDGIIYDYEPKAGAGWQAAVKLGVGYGEADQFVQAAQSASGAADLYFRMGSTLYYTAERGNDTKVIGGGWNIYNLLIGPGDMGGSTYDDIIGRHTDGSLWLYQGSASGTLATKVRIGTSGWNGMDALTGRGDYTGDGKNDLIARSTSGTLYIYPGTGKVTADSAFSPRVTVGSGWNTYKRLVSTGDQDGDGKPDLIAVDAAGALWLLPGTGNASAPFAARVQIGTSGWSAFNVLF